MTWVELARLCSAEIEREEKRKGMHSGILGSPIPSLIDISLETQNVYHPRYYVHGTKQRAPRKRQDSRDKHILQYTCARTVCDAKRDYSNPSRLTDKGPESHCIIREIDGQETQRDLRSPMSSMGRHTFKHHGCPVSIWIIPEPVAWVSERYLADECNSLTCLYRRCSTVYLRV